MEGALNRRRLLAIGGLAAVGAGVAVVDQGRAASLFAGLDGVSPTAPRAPGPPYPPGPRTVEDARRAGWTVVTDFGAVGDGHSRPLAIRYATLEAARRDHPFATSLDDELDGAAIRSAVDSGTDRVFYPPGRFVHDTAIRVRGGQRHLGAGTDTVLVNVRPRARPIDLPEAHTFAVGNVHPVTMNLAATEQAWALWPLAPIAAGDRTITAARPLTGAGVAVGDVVMIRSDGEPSPTGAHGVTYDFQMWNRVVAIDGRTISLAVAVPRDVVAAPADPEVLAGPTLCANAGRDPLTGEPWSVVQGVEIGNLAVDSAGLCLRTGVWRGHFHDLAITGENMVGFNALVESTVERVRGMFTNRMIEIKYASRDSVLSDVHGVHRAGSASGPPAPPISVGEQSYACTFDGIDCRIGPEVTEPVRALELYSPDLRFRGSIAHFGQGAHGQVWAIKSNDAPANPPARIALDLVVRSGGGLRAYGVIGDVTPRPSAPRDVTLRLDQRSEGEPPEIGVQVLAGSAIRTLRDVGDRTCARAAPGAELPQGSARC